MTDQIIRQLSQLTPEQQRQVLDFTTSLLRPHGEPGSEIIRHAHEIDFPPEDLAEIQRAIEQDCENINPDDRNRLKVAIEAGKDEAPQLMGPSSCSGLSPA